MGVVGGSSWDHYQKNPWEYHNLEAMMLAKVLRS